MIKDYFLTKIEDAIIKATTKGTLGQMKEYEKGSIVVERPKNSDFGDFAVNISSLARFAKMAPPAIANAIVENIDDSENEYSVVGGFINFKACDNLLAGLVEKIFKNRENYGKPQNINKEKINLEYISANPTGPFHIGHGRWAVVGSVLTNLLKFYGHDVYQEFYINDAGAQIKKLGNSLAIRIRQELGENIDFPEDELERKNFYPGDYLIPVAKKFIEDNTDILSEVKNDVTKIDVQILSDFAKDEMELRQKELLERFRVHFDKFYSELDLHNSGKVDACFEELKNKGKIYEKDGAYWFRSSDYGDDQDRVVKRSDGTNTYLTADIAYHADKFNRGFDRLINIWGADHHGYIARVKASLEALGYNPDKLEILLGQLVNLVINGNEVRMGKRKNMVTLDDLIDEVGVDATRFWMAMRNIDTTLDFDIELAKKNSDENPVFYVQYAHARCCSILRNATSPIIDRETGNSLPAPIATSELNELVDNFKSSMVIPTIKTARQIILKLEEFTSMIKSSAENRQIYTICRYLQELASEFHSFYNANRVISEDKDMMKARLAIVWAVKTVIFIALEKLLDVSAPEKM